MNLFRLTSLLCIGLFALSAQAALHDRGNGLIYDDVKNLTWLKDANHAKTSGYDADGKMTWHEAKDWADQLVVGGGTEWRLPKANPRGSAALCGDNDGGCDLGYNNINSEMGYMFYTNLENQGRYDSDNNYQSNFSSNDNSFVDGTNGETIEIENLQMDFYWLDEELWCFNYSAWLFNAEDGLQYHHIKDYNFYSWAVHDGDVSAVPVPAAAWLFASALIALAGVKRRHC